MPKEWVVCPKESTNVETSRGHCPNLINRLQLNVDFTTQVVFMIFEPALAMVQCFLCRKGAHKTFSFSGRCFFSFFSETFPLQSLAKIKPCRGALNLLWLKSYYSWFESAPCMRHTPPPASPPPLAILLHRESFEISFWPPVQLEVGRVNGRRREELYLKQDGFGSEEGQKRWWGGMHFQKILFFQIKKKNCTF